MRIALALWLVANAAHAQPLDGPSRAVLEALPHEETPVPEEHYPGSNEWRHDLFFDAIRDLGGAFVGVGADQCYTLAAAQNASIVFLVDYDAEIPRIHRMYERLVSASPTPAELVARFETANVAATMDLLADPELQRTFRRHRPGLRPYLHHVARLRRDGRGTSWLSDPVLYERTRALFANGRVVARTGDVTGQSTLRAIGAAAQRLNVSVRVVYFSNAEQFFRYTEGSFQENVRALPADERTVVLRTFRHPRMTPYPEDDTWHYMVHPMSDFLERLSLGYRRNTHIVMDAVRAGLDLRGVTTIRANMPRDYVRPPSTSLRAGLPR